jgi:hypothetical protein
MIEAVNSVIASAQVDRSAPAQVDAARSYAANPERVQEAKPVVQAPYISPYIVMNNDYNKAVIQIRDSSTGDVLKEFPSENVLEARQQAEVSRQQTKPARQLNIFDSSVEPQTFEEPVSRDTAHFEAPATTSTATTTPAPAAPSSPRPETQVAVAALVAASQTAHGPSSSVSVTA